MGALMAEVDVASAISEIKGDLKRITEVMIAMAKVQTDQKNDRQNFEEYKHRNDTRVDRLEIRTDKVDSKLTKWGGAIVVIIALPGLALSCLTVLKLFGWI